MTPENRAAVMTSLIAAASAVVGALGGAYLKGNTDVALAERKFYSDLVLKALESPSPEERVKTLQMLTKTHLIKDKEVSEGVEAYAKEASANPGIVPQVKPTTAVASAPPPPSEGTRVYLLSGTAARAEDFTVLKAELSAAHVQLLGAKTIVDAGRQDGPEIRYFFADDANTAKAILEHVNFALKGRTFTVKQYQDSQVRPGYVEVWLGR
ncbi:hypothetical protein [Phenylobacterium aquaticum]|uniref:hypothetical protein n=1 Tax=Phenylobacterium aquaticum TaxID=1763816 RepID=UPI0026F03E8B|nr:hypothetical protein [Phenylobacterium aquaticum]